MSKVIELRSVTRATIPPERILGGALKATLTDVVVIGRRPDGAVYFAMSSAEAPAINWMLDCAKRLLMDDIMDDEHG